MRFSIIVPVYRVEEYLDRCVQSLVNQTFTDIEIILVDDGSPDRCPEMCDAWASRDARIKVVHKQNGGLSDARNAGLAVASGDYVIFVDSDDKIELECAEVIKGVIEDNAYPTVVAMNGAQQTGEIFVDVKNPNIPKQVLCGKEYLSRALKYGFFRTEAWLSSYKLEFLRENNLSFKVGIHHEDTQFTPRAYFLAKSIAFCDKLLYSYTINPNSIMHKKDYRKNCRDIYAVGLEHSQNFKGKADATLYKNLMDFMVIQYLSIFNMGRCVEYGREYAHKRFVLRFAHKFRTRLHACLFSISPRFYSYLINRR